MRLSDLTEFGKITIQCHDNPDADALASGFGLYCFFAQNGVDVHLIYSGVNRIQKANLRLMVDELDIPVEYWPPLPQGIRKVDGLLLTVDCQYGAGNVTPLQADAVAMIDHHQAETEGNSLNRIHPGLGSCATLVWSMLEEEGFAITDNRLGTALYYGLYTDSNQFSEIYNPLDMDMRDSIVYNKSLIARFRNSNLSLKELEIAGIALIRYSYNPDYRFGVIHAQPCDPNILGLISDFLLQVDEIDTCVVYNQMGDGFKFSVRSCIKEVHANELAGFLARDIGSGGGHEDKAGGFISGRLYEQNFPTMHSEGYFNNRMTRYFDSHEIINEKDYKLDKSQMEVYEKKQIPEGFVLLGDFFAEGTQITIRTMRGDISLEVSERMVLKIGEKGQVRLLDKEQFLGNYHMTEEPYCKDNCARKTEYVPIIKNREEGSSMVVASCAKVCYPIAGQLVYGKKLEKAVKLFTRWNQEHYALGKLGDYLVVRCDDSSDLTVVEREEFENGYEKK